MKIAVVGCGAVGSFYGAKLAQAGHEVHFLLRSDYEAVRSNGVLIQSPQGDFRVRPRAAKQPEAIGPSELVLIALKTTANEQFPRLLPPLVSQGTAVLTLQNGLGNEEALARLFSPESILGGLCFVCLNRVKPGCIHHIAHGKVIIGEYAGWPEPRTQDIAGLFRHAGVACSVTDNLARTHWEKLTWNVPFNGLGVAGIAGYDAVIEGKLNPGEADASKPCLTTDILLRDPKWESLLRELMREVIRAANAMRYELPDAVEETQIERTRSMGPYKASTLLDFEKGLPLELNSLFLEPLRQAQAAGVKVPRLKSMCQILQQLDELRTPP